MKQRYGLVWVVLVALLACSQGGPLPAAAQDAPGVCEGQVCGPSGAFSPEAFPTLTPVSWEALPRPIPRSDLVPGSGGRVIYVAQDASGDGSAGAPFGSLNAAVAVAQPGDVIWVADGVYRIGEPDEYDALVLDTPRVKLVAERPGSVVLSPASAANAIGIVARADDVVIDGFVLSGFREAGIEFGNVRTPQRNLRIQHVIVENTPEGIRTAYGGDGAQPVIDGMLLYDAWLRDISVIALQCGEGPCDNLRWEALRITMGGGAGDDSGADAIAVESGNMAVVFNAEITGAPGDGIDLKSEAGVVANVMVHDVGRNGIKLWHAGDIINALVYNTGADAAIVFEAGEYRILNTIVARHAQGERAYAMTAAYDTADRPGHLEIVNSVFYQNSGPVWISPNLEFIALHSMFAESANNVELVWHEEYGIDGPPVIALNDTPHGTGVLEARDPLFRDIDAGDFAPQPGSPLIDAGTDAVPLPDFDLTGGPRVQGGAVDLGPFEAR